MTTPKETHEAYFLANLACEQLEKISKSKDNKPFNMSIHFWGPHQPFYATQEFVELYDPQQIPEYPNFRDDLETKPKIYKYEPNYPLNEKGRLIQPNPLPWKSWQEVLSFKYAQTTLIDHAGGLILDTLEKLELDHNTLVIWTTDHGDSVASHGGHFDKDCFMPEEMIKIPMVMKYSNIIPAGQKCDKLVSLIDLAPTILDIAGTKFNEPIDGQTLIPLCINPNIEWREDLMVEMHGHIHLHLGRAIIYNHYKYIWNYRDLDELYDLKEDPYEMNNLINDKKYSEILQNMKHLLTKWRKHTNDNMEKKFIRKITSQGAGRSYTSLAYGDSK
jgi:arylsulfatase A-like enzyme